MNLNTRIMSHSKSILSRKEKLIDDFIEHNPHLVIALPIGELAQKMEIGVSNLSRYVRKIGFKKYIDFRFYFSKRIEFLALNRNIEKNSMEFIINNNVNFMHFALKETSSRISVKQLELIYQLFITSDITLTFGLGGSGLAACDLSTKLMESSINSAHYWDYHHIKQILRHSVKNKSKKITLLLFSRSLASREIETIFNIINGEKHIKVITITSNKAIKNYKVAVNLQYQILETDSHYEISSKICQIYLNSLIFHFISLKNKS